VYNAGNSAGGPESIITGRPTFDASTNRTNTIKTYSSKVFVAAWENLVLASPQLKKATGFQYDLVDVTRQALVNYADTLQRAFAAAWVKKDQGLFNQLSRKFLTLIDDVDRLLATREDFLLGKWISDARSWGVNAGEKALFERNARDLITLWGDEKASLHEYSCRQWSGMLRHFYKPRWEQFFQYVNTQWQQNKPIDQKLFETQVAHWEWQWVNGAEVYPHTPNGDPVAVAGQLYQKYHTEIMAVYQ